MLTGFPMILDGSSWYLIYTVLALAFIVAPVLWGFTTALAGRSLFADLEGD
jgi:hypothetical protein